MTSALTCAQHGHELFDFVDAAVLHDVVVDEGIFLVEFDLHACDIHVSCVCVSLRENIGEKGEYQT